MAESQTSAKRLGAREWHTLVSKLAESGEDLIRFSRRQGIHPPTLRWWRLRGATRGLARAPRPAPAAAAGAGRGASAGPQLEPLSRHRPPAPRQRKPSSGPDATRFSAARQREWAGRQSFATTRAMGHSGASTIGDYRLHRDP